jgi:hypothetical protein
MADVGNVATGATAATAATPTTILNRSLFMSFLLTPERRLSI